MKCLQRTCYEQSPEGEPPQKKVKREDELLQYQPYQQQQHTQPHKRQLQPIQHYKEGVSKGSPDYTRGTRVRMKRSGIEGVIIEEKFGGWRVVQFDNGKISKTRPSELYLLQELKTEPSPMMKEEEKQEEQEQEEEKQDQDQENDTIIPSFSIEAPTTLTEIKTTKDMEEEDTVATETQETSTVNGNEQNTNLP